MINLTCISVDQLATGEQLARWAQVSVVAGVILS